MESGLERIVIRVLAEFDDQLAAFAAIQSLAASSYNVDDLKLNAVRADGTTVDLPVRERSWVVPGFLLGGLIGVVGGAVVGLTALPGAGTLGSTVAVGSGVGAAVGAAMGIGWWHIAISKRAIPADASAFVVVVTVPEGRAEETRADLARLGGREGTPRLLA